MQCKQLSPEKKNLSTKEKYQTKNPIVQTQTKQSTKQIVLFLILLGYH
jgi:hypothetical protein